MLNSKALVFILFAAWSVLCWRWYVCSVKQACDRDAITYEDITVTPPLEPDTALENSRVTSSRDAANKEPFSPSRIDKIQFEAVEDRMLIHFPYNSVRKEDDEAIDEYLSSLARELIASSETITITGHTDFVGHNKFNQKLGQLRANSIRDNLVRKDVKKEQINCKSYGERKPVATNDTPQGRYLNRRVEIKVGK